MINKLDWSSFKNIINSKVLSIQMIEREFDYKLSAFDNQIMYSCDIIKQTPASTEQTDFETNYKLKVNKPVSPKDSLGRNLLTSSPFTDASGFRFRGASFSGIVAGLGVVTNLDYKIIEERYINGGRLLVDSIGPNDQIVFQVIDKDNILGFGANVVLDEFITDYFVPTSGNLEVKLDYPAKIMPGLYIRLKYKNTGDMSTVVKCNLYLHWKAS